MAEAYSVSQINRYIAAMFQQDFLMERLSVTGEVSNCKYHSSGHIYFTLKDEKAAIACVLFAGNRDGLTFRLENGQSVVVSGHIGVYERSGVYQLYARSIRQGGLGLLYEKFEALKRTLEEMGMFDAAYKKPLPRFIHTLGVVTAPTGAAVRDIIQIARRRNPGIRILLYPAKVQGEGAAQSIAQGIRAMEKTSAQVIIVGRGGGSLEDLWAFNEEVTARAVFACSVPVISAVGHETDTVITDYVADLRAPTPSAAAQLAVADMRETLMTLGQARGRMSQLMGQHLDRCRSMLDNRRLRMKLGSPRHQLEQKQQLLAEAQDKLSAGMKRRITESRGALQLALARLSGCSPYEKLRQGYAFVTGSGGQRVTLASQVRENELLTVRFADGALEARVEKISQGGSRIECEEGAEKHEQ